MVKKIQGAIAVFVVCFLFVGCTTPSYVPAISNVPSKDEVPIAYSVYGKGDVTLAFIHGWSCDSRYWYNQAPYFAKKYRVVTIDLAGHGNSGLSRKTYTMKSFGEDVAAVLEEINAEKAVLIGHSMGGTVILEAARLAPDRVIGVIGIDTLEDMGRKSTDEEKAGFYDPLVEDFVPNVRKMIYSMLPKDVDKNLAETIARDMSSAPQSIALSALRELMKASDADLVKQIDVPVKCVNADLWPTNIEGNKKLVPSYEAAIMKGYGHFIMLEAPEEFNRLLDETIQKIVTP